MYSVLLRGPLPSDTRLWVPLHTFLSVPRDVTGWQLFFSFRTQRTLLATRAIAGVWVYQVQVMPFWLSFSTLDKQSGSLGYSWSRTSVPPSHYFLGFFSSMDKNQLRKKTLLFLKARVSQYIALLHMYFFLLCHFVQFCLILCPNCPIVSIFRTYCPIMSILFI